MKKYDEYITEYAHDAIDYIKDTIKLKEDDTIADIGCGTGSVSKHFLKYNFKVIGVEPDKDLGKQALKALKTRKNFHIVNGTAEKTNLDDNSVNLIVVGNSLEYFNLKAFKQECRRILVPNGNIAILSNVWSKKESKTVFLVNETNKLFCPKYADYDISANDRLYLLGNDYNIKTFDNDLFLDLDAFIKICLNTPYALSRNDIFCEEYIKVITDIFNTYSVDDVKDGKKRILIPNKTICRISKNNT